MMGTTSCAFENPPAVLSKVTPAAAASVLQFERSDISLFRNLSTLAQKAGVPQSSLVKLAYKELADNALDAGANVSFEYDEESGLTWVKDDGPGIDGTDEQIAALFSIGRPLRSSKLLRLPTRGALGNGTRVVVGLVLCTGGRLVVRTRGRELELKPKDNGDTAVGAVRPWSGSGTEVGVDFGCVDDDALDWAQLAAEYAGGEQYRGASSPYWYDAEAFFELCAAAPPGLSPRALIERMDGCSGRKAGQIAAEFLNRQARDLSRREAEDLLRRAREHGRLVNPKRLGCVGERARFHGYAKEIGTIEISGRAGSLRAELPVVVEVWARAAACGSVRLLVNRTPAAAPQSVTYFDKHLQVTASGYVGDVLPRGGHKYAIEINIITPHMPIVSDGKAPDLARFGTLLDPAIKLAVNRAKAAVGVRRDDEQDRPERSTIKDSVLDHLKQAIDLASGEGRYRFNQRNLFYQVRPMVLRDDVGELTYEYFCSIITDLELDAGPVEGMYRNERGILIHPHTRQVFGLGTLTVEKYARPSWTFNKVLYVEKEGFFQTLLADGWPERHDCALMTSQGFASRAARDLIDALGDTEEPVEIFCVHDADAFGTKIYETLQEATRARPGRRVRIVNLGLERAEAEAMGLECETLAPSKKEKPTAAYVNAEDHEWYQTHRYELNAMTAPQLIAWLDEKMAPYGGKVMPPADVMRKAVRARIEELVRAAEIERVLREANIEEITRLRLDEMGAAVDAAVSDLDDQVRRRLDDDPEQPWVAVVEAIGAEVLEGVRP